MLKLFSGLFVPFFFIMSWVCMISPLLIIGCVISKVSTGVKQLAWLLFCHATGLCLAVVVGVVVIYFMLNGRSLWA